MSDIIDTQSKNIENSLQLYEEIPVMVDFHNYTELLKYGVTFHWWDSLATTLHFHNHYEFFIITQGQVRHKLNNTITVLQKNTLQMITPQDVHQLSPTENTLCIHMNIAITSEKMSEICKALSVSEDTIANLPIKQLNLSESERGFFLQRAEQIYYLNETTKNLDLTNTILVEMVIEILSLLLLRKNTANDVFPEWFSKIITQMHSPEFLDKSVKDIYALSNYSAPIIIKYFKRFTNKTILQYFTEIKMNNARELIKKTDMTTLSIASRLGYNSLSHFNKLFKATFKMTPTMYKLQNK